MASTRSSPNCDTPHSPQNRGVSRSQTRVDEQSEMRRSSLPHNDSATVVGHPPRKRGPCDREPLGLNSADPESQRQARQRHSSRSGGAHLKRLPSSLDLPAAARREQESNRSPLPPVATHPRSHRKPKRKRSIRSHIKRKNAVLARPPDQKCGGEPRRSSSSDRKHGEEAAAVVPSHMSHPKRRYKSSSHTSHAPHTADEARRRKPSQRPRSRLSIKSRASSTSSEMHPHNPQSPGAMPPENSDFTEHNTMENELASSRRNRNQPAPLLDIGHTSNTDVQSPSSLSSDSARMGEAPRSSRSISSRRRRNVSPVRKRDNKRRRRPSLKRGSLAPTNNSREARREDLRVSEGRTRHLKGTCSLDFIM